MKKTLIFLSLFLTSISAYGNNSNKMNIIFEDIKRELKDQSNNISFTDIVCGTLGCKFEVIENGMINGDVVLKEELNNETQVSKIKIEAHSNLLNSNGFIMAVCLPSNECKYFENKNVLSIDYAFDNGFFKKERTKRKVNKKVLEYLGLGLVMERVSREFGKLNDTIDNKVISAYERLKKEYQEADQDWNQMIENRRMYETRIVSNNSGNYQSNRDYNGYGGSTGAHGRTVDRPSKSPGSTAERNSRIAR